MVGIIESAAPFEDKKFEQSIGEIQNAIEKKNSYGDQKLKLSKKKTIRLSQSSQLIDNRKNTTPLESETDLNESMEEGFRLVNSRNDYMDPYQSQTIAH